MRCGGAATALDASGDFQHRSRCLFAIDLLASTLLYLVPHTSILGAVLLTGYLGGAVATHVRVSDSNFVFPVIFGALLWGGLWLRDGRVRDLLPVRAL